MKKGGHKNIDPHGGVKFKVGDKAAQKWTEELALLFADALITWMHEADENIFYEEFIFMVAKRMPEFEIFKININTPNYLAKCYSSFLERIKEAKKIQEIKLKKFGAFDKLNASIVKFLLNAEHGIKETTVSEVEMNVSTPKTLDDWYNKNRSKYNSNEEDD